MKNISKSEAGKKIKEFFEDIKNKTPREIRKIKKLAMSKNIPLKEKRKLFCRKCFTPYCTPKIRIKNKIKSVTCEECGYVAKWRIR